MVKLLIIIVTQHSLQNRVSDIIMHVTLNIVNGVTPKTYTILPSLKISEG
jgi:hypothetical protein